jgi:hypothetical protein
MIEARELRIGNYVSNGKKTVLVDAHTIYDNSGTCNGLLKPIKITNHWLVILGAEKIPENRFHVTLYCFEGSDSQKWCVGFVDGNWSLFESESDAGCNAVNHSELKYIHKLQNLLFEVANVELTIK